MHVHVLSKSKIDKGTCLTCLIANISLNPRLGKLGDIGGYVYLHTGFFVREGEGQE